MKTNIIGFGVVGRAQGYLMEKFGHKVFSYDPIKFPKKQLEQKVGLTFICTPEAVIEDVIVILIEKQVEGLYVIKSTVPVRETERLRKKYNVHICHNPEFLREKQSFEDVLNPSRIVIGQCCVEHGDLLQKLYESLNKPIYRTDSTTSELSKLVANGHLAVLITFWNEINELTEQLDVDVKEVVKLVSADKRISRYGTAKFGEPFGGKCLPKDVDHLIGVYRVAGLNPLLFEAIREFNGKLGDMKNDT